MEWFDFQREVMEMVLICGISTSGGLFFQASLFSYFFLSVATPFLKKSAAGGAAGVFHHTYLLSQLHLSPWVITVLGISPVVSYQSELHLLKRF